MERQLYGDDHKKVLRAAIENLGELVRLTVQKGVENVKDFKSWAKENARVLNELFWYEHQGDMPEMRSLFSPFYHPALPLVGLNYTPVAHNVLHAVPAGWTVPLRICRGVVFEQTGRLVALPFVKFFNLNENPETVMANVPRDKPFTASAKMDGHLSIGFRYAGRDMMTTRGSFESPTAKLGNEKLAKLARKNKWRDIARLDHTTIMSEFLDPTTRVHVDYTDDEDGFVLIGANDIETLDDLHYPELLDLDRELNLRVTEPWQGDNLDELVAHMKDRSVTNKEGFVVRVGDLRFKVKYETYIGEMVKAKLSYTYLMNRFASGNLEKKLITLDEEIRNVALQMLGRIMICLSRPGTPREKWQWLYELVDVDEQTSYFQQVCRNFVKSLYEVKK